MRGGALPVLAWAALLALLMAGAWVWTGEAIEVGVLAFAVLMILLSGVALAAANRDALRRGPPPAATRELEAVPQLSVGAALAPFALASIFFGLAFGHFLIYFGAGLLALSLGRWALELRAEARARRRVREGQSGSDGGHPRSAR